MADPVSQQSLSDLIRGDNEAFSKGQNTFGIDFTKSVPEVRAAVAKLPTEKQPDALKAWASVFVSRERGQGGVGMWLDDRARAIARGTWAGSFLDEVSAKTDDTLHKATFGYFGAPEEESLAYQRARDEAFDEANPWQARGLKFGGAIGSLLASRGAGGLAGGLLSPGAGVGTSGALLTRMAPSAILGTGLGTVHGFGEGEGGLENRTTSALAGGVIGGGLGMLAPFLGAGLQQGIGFVGNRLAALPGALRGYNRGAVDRVAGAVSDDAASGQQFQNAAQRLGPERMVLDMGPGVLGHAETIAQRPGAGAGQVLRAVTERGQGAAGRITADVDAALGARRDIPALLQQMGLDRAQEAAQNYGILRGQGGSLANSQQPVWGPGLQALTSRPSVRQAIDAVLDTAAERGIALRDPFRRLQNGRLTLQNGRVQPSFEFWDTVKRHLDLQVARDPANGDLVRTVAALRDELDRLVPGYAQARQAFQARSQVIEGVEEGQEAFRRGIDPSQLRADLAARTPEAQAGFRLGARQNIANVMGEAVDPESAARRAFASPFARERLDTVLGPQNAQRLTNRLDAETTFQAAENRVRGNSATARRQAFGELYPAPAGQAAGNQLKEQNLTGWGLFLANRIWNASRSAASDRERARIAEDAARLLTASGDQADGIIAALQQRAARLSRVSRQQGRADEMLQAIIQSMRQPIVQEYIGQ